MMKIKIIVFVNKNKTLAKSRKRFRNNLSSDFFKNEASSLKFIKTDKLLDQARKQTSVLKKIDNFEKKIYQSLIISECLLSQSSR